MLQYRIYEYGITAQKTINHQVLALILLFHVTGVRIWHLPPFAPHTPICDKSALRESACRVDLLSDGHRRSKKIIPVGDAAIAATDAEKYIESARARSGK